MDLLHKRSSFRAFSMYITYQRKRSFEIFEGYVKSVEKKVADRGDRSSNSLHLKTRDRYKTKPSKKGPTNITAQNLSTR